MISIKQLSPEEWLVTVNSRSATEHRVRLTSPDLARLAPGHSPEQLLQASFRFLLAREPNTSILSSFDLPIISRYFPEYERELKLELKKED